MKFHAYPKLLITIGALSVAAVFGLSAQAFDDSAATMERFSPAAALADGSQASPAAKRHKNLNSLLGIDEGGVSSRAAVCGDEEPDDGEECDDGNLDDGDGCDSACQIEPGSDCTAAIASQLTQDIMGDGSFEDNDGSWTLAGTAFSPRCSPSLCGPDLAFEGTHYLWIAGGFFDGGNNPGTATQTIVIPASASTLTWQYGFGSNALPNGTCESDTDRLEVVIDATVQFSTPAPCTEVPLYTQGSIDLAALGLNDDAPHTITFRGFNEDNPPGGGLLTNIFLDDVQLNVPATPPIPAVPSSCLVGVCGDSILTDVEQCDDGNAVGGDGCSATCEVEADFVCTDPTLDSFNVLAGDLGTATREGSLEDKRGRITGEWDESRVGATDLLPICSEVFCSFISVNISSDGIFYALFGASLDPSDTQISQTTTIPVGANDLTFDFFVATPAVTACDSTDDFLEVTVDGTQVFLYDCVTPISEYTEQTADISAFADGGDHEIIVRGVTLGTNGLNTNFFVDNVQIPLATTAVPTPSTCTALPTACGPTETFDGPGLPAGWTVVNLSVNPADGWGTDGDGVCLAENASALADFFGPNLTGGAGGVACADSDATGQIAIDGGGSATEMDSYLCTPSLDLSTITGPRYSFLTNYQSANNQFNDNGTPDDGADDFDEDLLEVLVGTSAPNALSVPNYTRLGGVNDHEDGNLLLTWKQELSANLEGSDLEGAAEGYVCFRYLGTYAWFGQIDNATLRGDDCTTPPADTDGDGVFDSVDNCTNVANADQRDSNGDGFGNVCDFDYNNSCVTNFADLGLFGPSFNALDNGLPGPFGGLYSADLDLDDNGVINFQDLGLAPNNFAAAFTNPPGPSANECIPE